MTDLLVDANSLYARAWYATHENPAETLTATLNLSAMVLNPTRLGERVDRVLYAWDGDNHREKGRKERPPEYEGTKPVVMQWIEYLYGAVNVRVESYEADDVVATAATMSKAEHVIVVSADKDLHQLSSSRVSIFDPGAKGMVSRREILARWHVKRPSQVAIALAIQGDQADKIPGIKGWGQKKVEKLFEAVTDKMSFEEAFEAIRGQIPDSKLEEFESSLVLTLLNCGIPDVPEPSPLSFVPIAELERLDLNQGFLDHYAQVSSAYRHHVTDIEDVLQRER